MEEKSEGLGEQLKRSLETKTEIVRLTVVQKSAQLLSESMVWLSLFLLLLPLILFGGFAAAAWLKELTGKESLAYLIVTCFFLLLVLFIYFRRKGIERSVEDRFISKMTQHENDH